MESALFKWEDYGLPKERVYHIAFMDCPSGFSYPSHLHSGQWELVYALSGTFTHALNETSLSQGPGSLALVRERDRHSLRGSRFSYYNLSFRLEALAAVEAAIGANAEGGSRLSPLREAERVPLALADDELRPRLESELYALLASYDPLRFVSFMGQALSLLLERSEGGVSGAKPGAGGGAPEWLRVACAWAASRQRPPEVAELVSRCGRSKEHVSRSFAKWRGQSPSAYLAELRLQMAARLLAQTNAKIGAVAEDSGFSSLNHFHALFKERYGQTPAEYRREHSAIAHGPAGPVR
jgi:AraC-like DNA-binding protein